MTACADKPVGSYENGNELPIEATVAAATEVPEEEEAWAFLPGAAVGKDGLGLEVRVLVEKRLTRDNVVGLLDEEERMRGWRE